MARSFSKMTPHFCPDPNRDPDGNRNRQETVQTTEQTANNLERTGAESSRKQQTVARITAHNPEVAGSSPVSATRKRQLSIWTAVFLVIQRNFHRKHTAPAAGYLPNTSRAWRMCSITCTPKGQRCSQLPQEIHAPAGCSSKA